MNEAFEKGWIDVYPNAQKRSGAFSASVYGRHPYVLMNYQNSQDDLSTLVTEVEGSEAVPTAAFQRVIQRAAIHVQSSGRSEVTGANVLVAIFAERESNAAYFLQEQDMTRYDAVNFIAHGVAKNHSFGEARPVTGATEIEDEAAEAAALAEVAERAYQAQMAELARLLEDGALIRGEVVSREGLLDAVWGYDTIPFTRTVDTHIAKLRKKIEDDPADPEHLITVHRLGYKFVG
mgnify:CR=1 FL=1